MTMPTAGKMLAKPIVFSPAAGAHRDPKRKKIELKEVFNPDEDDSAVLPAKKRKLVPIDYMDDKKKKEPQDMDQDQQQHYHHQQQQQAAQAAQQPPLPGKEGGDAAAAAAAGGKKTSEDVAKSQEEKRKHIKKLIDRIPTEKEAIFAYQLDWSAVDNTLMEKRIRPWINKKIIDYIGEPEPTLVDFICSKVLAGSQPQVILDDVQMVLDEEAEVFVVKMWRLLIYELEAKKSGLAK